MYNYKIKISFFSPDMPKARANKTGFNTMLDIIFHMAETVRTGYKGSYILNYERQKYHASMFFKECCLLSHYCSGKKTFKNQSLYQNNRMSSVCRFKDLTVEPIWFSFTKFLLIGPGNVYKYFNKKK